MTFQFRPHNYQVLQHHGEIIEHGKVVGECPECNLIYGDEELQCGRCGFIFDEGLRQHIDDKHREAGDWDFDYEEGIDDE